MWGEAVTVKIKTSMSPMLNDKGTHCMFIGYTYNHLGDCYKMYDPKTRRTRETHDIIWLTWMFYKRLPNQRELTTEPITYDVIQDQHHDQEQDQDNNQQSEHKTMMRCKLLTIQQAMKMGRATMAPMIKLSNQTTTNKKVLKMTMKNPLPNETRTTTTSSGCAVQ